MKLRGGYDVPLAGRPAGRIEALPEPHVLHLPTRSQRLGFADLAVAEGERVRAGQALARDPDTFGLPLLAPRGGTVRLAAAGHVTLEDLAPPGPLAGGEAGPGPRRKLVDLGAWQFLEDAHTGAVCDPELAPAAVIVSTLRLEPFGPRGDVGLAGSLDEFVRGLEAVQSLLEYQPIYLVLPDIHAPLAAEVHGRMRGHAWAKLVQVPLKYPYDHFTILARYLDLPHRPDEPVWALRTDGVLALEAALVHGAPVTDRLITLGGAGAQRPAHFRAVTGYPLAKLLAGRTEAKVRVLAGGALTGRIAGDDCLGLDAECAALTVLPDEPRRELLGFARPGADRQSFDRTFLSRLLPPFAERLTTELRGERRACVACGYCEEVCPAGIWPHLIHKYLYRDSLTDAEAARVDLCVRCGLCSYVCPSKIELMDQFIDAQQRIAEEHRIEAAEAAKAAAREAQRQAAQAGEAGR